MKYIYLLFIGIGVVVPYSFMIPYASRTGLTWDKIINDIFNNDLSTFLVLDLLLSVAIFLVYMFRESAKRGMKRAPWICLAVLCSVGMCAAFPLFLYLREQHKSKI
jgi:hypothetical protein